MINFIKKPVVILITALIIILGVYFLFIKDKESVYEFIVVERGELLQEISVTGRVRPVADIDLAFEKTGRITGVNIDVGDKVFAGQVLVRLDGSELSAQLTKAESDLVTKEAELSESETDMVNFYASVIDVLSDAYVKADDAVRVKTAAIFGGSRESVYYLTFTVCDEEAKKDSINKRLLSDDALDEWKVELTTLTSESSDIEREQALKNAKNYLSDIKDFINRLNDVLTDDCVVNQSALDTYRTNVNIGRTNINTALTGVNDQEQSISSQKAEIISKEATIKSYQAAIQTIKAQLSKTVLYSPITGVVTEQNAKRGEIVGANEIMVSIISITQLEIEANIPEADIAKVEIGDVATLSLDAYSEDEIFRAIVVKINPAAELIEGVANYKTTLRLEGEDSRIRPGMTADLDIVTAERENIIVIPQRVVIFKNGFKLVRVLREGDLVEEVEVETGITGNRGRIEIISGIEEGDVVITAIKD